MALDNPGTLWRVTVDVDTVGPADGVAGYLRSVLAPYEVDAATLDRELCVSLTVVTTMPDATARALSIVSLAIKHAGGSVARIRRVEASLVEQPDRPRDGPVPRQPNDPEQPRPGPDRRAPRHSS